MTALIMTLVPLLSTLILSVFKRIPPVKNLSDSYRVASIRLANAVLAIIGTQVLFMLGGGDPVTTIHFEELLLAILPFLAADGAHNLLKSAGKTVAGTKSRRPDLSL